jgi:hypothetical protein
MSLWDIELALSLHHSVAAHLPYGTTASEPCLSEGEDLTVEIFKQVH